MIVKIPLSLKLSKKYRIIMFHLSVQNRPKILQSRSETTTKRSVNLKPLLSPIHPHKGAATIEANVTIIAQEAR